MTEELQENQQVEGQVDNTVKDDNASAGIDLPNDVKIVTDDEAQIEEILSAVEGAGESDEDTQPLPTGEQELSQDGSSTDTTGEAQAGSDDGQLEGRQEEAFQGQLAPVEPVPLDTLEGNISQLVGDELKKLDSILDTGEGSIAETMRTALAKVVQAIGTEIAGTLQPVIVPLQQQMQVQQAQMLWNEFSSKHPDANEPQIYDTMRSILEKGEATTYEAAYDLARFRTGKAGGSNGNAQSSNPGAADKAKKAAAALLSSAATRAPNVSPNNSADSVEDALNKAFVQLGLK